jgi:hypothetical protein
MDELVTSGRSVSIGVSGCVHSAAAVEPIPARDAATSVASLGARIGVVRVDGHRALCCLLHITQLFFDAQRAFVELDGFGDFSGPPQ